MKMSDDLYVANWTILPEASKACYELVSYKCKKASVKKCKCKKKLVLECTILCTCAGECLKIDTLCYIIACMLRPVVTTT